MRMGVCSGMKMIDRPQFRSFYSPDRRLFEETGVPIAHEELFQRVPNNHNHTH